MTNIELRQNGLKVPVELERMPAPPRAWALAKAAYETAREASLAEQRRVIAEITVDDPEPHSAIGRRASRDESLANLEQWQAWFCRNKAKFEAPINAVIAKHKVLDLDELYRSAENNLVDWSEGIIKKHYGDRYAAIKGAFDAYRDGRMFGDMRDKFLKICFNCQEKP